MKSTFAYLASVAIIGLLTALPYAYKRGFAAGAESVHAAAPPTNQPRSEASGTPSPDAVSPSEPLLPQGEVATSTEPAPEPSREHQAVDYKISQLSPSTPVEQALQLWAEIEALPNSSEKRQSQANFLKTFGQHHGEAAFIAMLADKGPNALRSLGPLAAGWAKNEPDAAWAALLAASNHGAIRGVDLRSTITEVAQSNLSGAIQMINDLQGDRRDREYRNLANKQNSPESFQTMLETSLQIPDDTFRERAMRSLFDAWSGFDFDSSLDAIKALPDPSLAQSSMHGLLQSWSQRDGSEAFAYILENQGDPSIDGAFVNVTRNWLRSSSAFEADEIFAALATIPERDETIFELASELVAANPEATLAMVEAIEDDRLRQRGLSKSIHFWSRNDLDGAEAYTFSMQDSQTQASLLPTLSRARMREGGSLDQYAQAIGEMEDANDRRRALIGLKRGLENLGAEANPEQAASVDAILTQFASDMENVTFMPNGGVRIRNSNTRPERIKTP